MFSVVQPTTSPMQAPPGSAGTSAPRERLPNFLLSPVGGISPPGPITGAATAAASGQAQYPSGYAITGANKAYGTPTAQNALAPPSFNERLRPSASSSGARASPTNNPHTPTSAPSTPQDSRLGSMYRRPGLYPASAGAASHHHSGTPFARKPPTRSLLDSGPGVLALYSPTPTNTTLPDDRATPHDPRAPNATASLTPIAYATGTPAQSFPMFTPDSSTAATPSSFIPRTPLTPGAAASANAPPVGAECWITVFGFPAAMESIVMRDLRRHGEIVRTLPSSGNWTHVMYRTPMQASVAAHRPWRLVANGTTMVGVTWCTEPELAEAAERDLDAGTMLIASPTHSAGSAHTTPIVMAGMPAVSPALSSSLRTPKSVVRGGLGNSSLGMMATPVGAGQSLAEQPSRAHSVGMQTPGRSSILRTPEPQRSFLSYIADFMSGDAR